jgi:hypothetical protein
LGEPQLRKTRLRLSSRLQGLPVALLGLRELPAQPVQLGLLIGGYVGGRAKVVVALGDGCPSASILSCRLAAWHGQDLVVPTNSTLSAGQMSATRCPRRDEGVQNTAMTTIQA